MLVSSAPSGRSRLEAAGLALITACIVGLYVYFGSAPGEPFLRPLTATGSEYYPLLVDGLLAGRLDLLVDPPPQLAKLADPYDPAQRAQAGIATKHDMSYYRGRYYLYFGVAPAVVLFLPYRLLTGGHFPQNLATVMFCAGGYLASLGLFLGLRRRFFPRSSTGLVWLGAIMLGLGNFCLPMLARNSVWEVPIASAYFFSCLGYWLLFQAWGGERWRVPRLAGAGAAFGLAIASRPNFVFFGAAIAAGWAWRCCRRWHDAKAAGGRESLREAGALLVPLGLVVAALLAYNDLRFGSPLEFGHKYQLGGGNQIREKAMGLEYLPVNFYYYFLAPAQFQRYFPFVEVIRGYPWKPPATYGGTEDTFGVLTNMPFWWLAAAAPVVWRRRFRQDRALLAVLGVLGLGFLVLAGTTSAFAGSTNRYEVDFLPSLQLVAAVGLLMLGGLDGRSRAARRWLGAGAIIAVAYTGIFNLGAAFQHNGMFKAHRPETYRALSAWFNRPAFRWDERHRQDYGPAELTVRFPQDRPGRAEPILVTGTSYHSDYLYVYYYPDGHRVQLGYTRTNYSHRLSQPIALDFSVPHRIGVVSGALYPPENHPYFSGRTTEEIAAAKQTLRVTVDGVPYLQARQEFFDTTPGFVTFGENRASDYIERKFTGDILEVRRGPAPPLTLPFRGESFVRLGLILPQGRPGVSEPLVATGREGAGDLLFVAYSDDAHIRLGFHHAGAPPVLSRLIPVNPGEIQVLEASLGSFYSHPANARERELAKMLVVRLNGVPIWPDEHVFGFHEAGDGAPAIGLNSWKSEASSPAFSGRIAAQEPCRLLPEVPDSPLSFAPYWLEAKEPLAYGAIRLHLMLPAQRAPKPEPLVVTQSSPNQADFAFVGTLARGQITLGYVHRGATAWQSHRLPVNLARPQVVEISLPSLYPPETDGYFTRYSLADINTLKTRARLKLNGATVLDEPASFLAAPTERVAIGENSQSEMLGPCFTGKILSVERSGPNPPSGFSGAAGPMEIVFTPAEGAAGNESLLATGGGSAWDVLLVAYEGSGRARFLVRTAGGARLTSAPVRLDSGARHTLRISWGGLYPDGARPASIAAAQWRQWQQAAAVTLDGSPVLDGKAEFVQAGPEIVNLGGATGAAEAFSGVIASVRGLPPGAP